MKHGDKEISVTKNTFSSFDRWCTTLFIWKMSFCNDLSKCLLVLVSTYIRFTKLNVFCIWLLSMSWFSSKIIMLFLMDLISAKLFKSPNKNSNNECIIPLCHIWVVLIEGSENVFNQSSQLGLGNLRFTIIEFICVQFEQYWMY